MNPSLQPLLGFLSPDFFSALVLLTIAVGLVLAALRIYGDFRQGPRFSQLPSAPLENMPVTPPESKGDLVR